MTKKDKRGLLILGIVLVFFLSFFNGRWNRKVINQSGRIGFFYVDDKTYSKAEPITNYHYFDNGIKTNDSYPCESAANVQKGYRFFGKYIPNKTESIICCYCLVPDDLEKQPKEGWSSLPAEYCSENEDYCWTE